MLVGGFSSARTRSGTRTNTKENRQPTKDKPPRGAASSSAYLKLEDLDKRHRKKQVRHVQKALVGLLLTHATTPSRTSVRAPAPSHPHPHTHPHTDIGRGVCKTAEPNIEGVQVTNFVTTPTHPTPHTHIHMQSLPHAYYTQEKQEVEHFGICRCATAAGRP